MAGVGTQLIDITNAVREKFWARVKKTKGCWLWTGAHSVGGYGNIRNGKTKYRAHRVSWTIHNGRIPHGRFICHTCDTPLCVNPSHLFLGDSVSNMEDAARKGRIPGFRGRHHGGEHNPHAKLSMKQVRMIRKSTVGPTEMARRLGVRYVQIWRIRKGIAWV